jgi:hypothetical protein
MSYSHFSSLIVMYIRNGWLVLSFGVFMKEELSVPVDFCWFVVCSLELDKKEVEGETWLTPVVTLWTQRIVVPYSVYVDQLTKSPLKIIILSRDSTSLVSSAKCSHSQNKHQKVINHLFFLRSLNQDDHWAKYVWLALLPKSRWTYLHLPSGITTSLLIFPDSCIFSRTIL